MEGITNTKALAKPYGNLLFYKLPIYVPIKEFNWNDFTQGKTLLPEATGCQIKISVPRVGDYLTL